MPVVSAKEVAKALNLEKLGVLGTAVGSAVLKITRLNKINRIYDERSDLPAIEFLDSVLKEFKVNYDIPEKDLKRIPAQGPFIAVANHPLGMIDGMILMRTLINQRPDFKVIANFLLSRLEPLDPYILPVNPFEDRKELKSSVTGIRSALEHIRDGKPFGIFPAGEVSTTKIDKTIVDRPWLPEALKLIQRAEVPIVPIYFHGHNSKAFYRLAKISDSLRTAKLPSEMVSRYNREVKVRIGNPIAVEIQKNYKDATEFGDFLRRKVYMLAGGFDKKSLLRNIPSHIKIPRPPKNIVNETSEELMYKEIEFCRENDKRLLHSNNFEVFLAQKKDIPNIIQEIGRLREITFRAIGEGTNKSIDLDEFDEYYHHLFLYDNQARKVVGAYRMGLGQEIFPQYGIRGFYLQKLFRFEPELHKMMSESIEMGRAFIIEEYQRRPTTLFYLWKGIVHCTLRFPNHKYLIGGVSISNKFSRFTKSLMIEFMMSHFYDPYVAQYIRPKKEFKVKLKDADKDFVFDESKADLNKFDRLIDELEPDNLRMPVLLKKYIKQNAKVVAFNVDPLFNNAVDGLMYIRIADLPESTVKPVMDEFQKSLEKKASAEDQKQ